MKKNLSEFGANIRNYIDLNKAFEIEGLGRLMRNDLPTSIDGNGRCLTPPSQQLKFIYEPTAKDQNAEVYKYEKAELAFELNTKGSCRIPGLGQFRKKKNRVVFEEVRQQGSQNQGLPVLYLQPLVPDLKEVPSTSIPSRISYRKEARKERNFLFGTAAAAAVFLMMLFAYHSLYAEEVYGPSISESSIEQSVDIDNARLNHSPEAVLVGEDVKPEYIPGKVEKKEVASCALVVGSFSRQSNAVEMQQQVIAAGYELYTEEFHEFYRVGISVDCSEIQGSTFLEIKSTLGVDPWLHISL